MESVTYLLTYLLAQRPVTVFGVSRLVDSIRSPEYDALVLYILQ